MSFPNNPFRFGSTDLPHARRCLDRAKKTVDGVQSEVGSFLQQGGQGGDAERTLAQARQQVAEFREVQAALNKARAVQARADKYALEMRAHGYLWDLERKLGRYFTTTQHKLIGFQAGLIVGALIGAGAAIVTLVLLFHTGGARL